MTCQGNSTAVRYTTSRQSRPGDSWMRRTLTTPRGTVHIDAADSGFRGQGFNYVLTVEGTDRLNVFVTLREAKDHAEHLTR